MRESGEFGGERNRSGKRFTVLRQPINEAYVMCLLRHHFSAGEDEIHRSRPADEARQPDRAQIDERHPEAAIENAENCGVRRESHQSASSIPPATAGPSIAAMTVTCSP